MKKYVLPVLLLILAGCASTDKKIKHINTPLSVAEMQQDLVFVKKRLFTMHPDADLYIDKDALNKKFDSVYNSLNTPLKPNEFHLKIAPIIAAVKQGHMRINGLTLPSTKAEIKKYKDTRGPLSQLNYRYFNDTLFVSHNHHLKNGVRPGSAVLKFNNKTPKELFEHYKLTYASDGYNQTYLPKGFTSRFYPEMLAMFGMQDSIPLTLLCEGSVNEVVLRRYSTKKETAQETSKDSLSKQIKTPIEQKKTKTVAHKIPKDSLTIIAKKEKELRKQKRILGYVDGNFNRTLSFPNPKDSTYAVLRIRSFSSGKFKKSYDSLFSTIQEKNIQHLVLDLRGNTGGLIADIDYLYRYLKKVEEPLISSSKINSKWKMPFYAVKGKSVAHYTFLSPIYALALPYLYTRTFTGANDQSEFRVAGLKATAPKAKAYTNKLDVLIDGATFSASSIISSNLQGSHRAKVYGEESGGTYNGTVAGIMPVLTLPNSKLKWRIGLMHIIPYHHKEVFGYGVMPDVPLNLSTDEKLFDEDAVYQLIP